LDHPLADVLSRLCGQRRESQATLVCLICPRQRGIGFDPPIIVREPEADPPIALNRIKGMKTEPSIRDIQHDPAIVRLYVDVGVPGNGGSRSSAAFQVCHALHHWVGRNHMGYLSIVQQSSPFNKRRTDLQEGNRTSDLVIAFRPWGVVGVFFRLQKSAPILHHSAFFARGEMASIDASEFGTLAGELS
jgi:hypothetical protein